MVRIDYADGAWGRSVLQPYGPIALQPAAAVFHYAQAAFEGMKAFRLADGGIGVFRPDANAARMNRSARRLAMPELPRSGSSRPSTRSSRPTPAGCPRATARASTCGR